jgi:hypothetical protein
MSELEDRLRAALAEFTEQSPAGLLDAVRRRHRRRTMRAGAGLLAVAVAPALAVPPLAGALGTGPGGAASGRGHNSHTVLVPAPGTVLSDCRTGPANLGALGTNWRSHEVVMAHGGPVWFLSGGYGHGPLRLFVAIVVLSGMRPGSLAAVRVAPAGRGYLRFLYGPRDSMNPQHARYTMRTGEAGVTFEACPGHGPVPSGRITDYYGGFLVKGNRCVPVRIWLPGTAGSFLVHLGLCSGG